VPPMSSGTRMTEPVLAASVAWTGTVPFSTTGLMRCMQAEPPPADSPPTVTLSGSPPKAAMLRCTQRSAERWSSSPRSPLKSASMPGMAMKPNTPIR